MRAPSPAIGVTWEIGPSNSRAGTKPYKTTLSLFSFAKITSRIMKEGYIMTWKQIEASREARLWIGQVIVPAVVGIMAVSPEARQTVKAKYVQVKNTIRRKLEKRG